MNLLLIRTYFQKGTNGIIYNGTSIICSTIELPWHNNKSRISCIPEGRYRMQMRYSQKFRKHIILTGVKDRSMILIHPANNALRELKGCIAPVLKITGEGKGSSSRLACNKLIRVVSQALKTRAVFLTIKNNHYDNKRKSEAAHTKVL